MTKPSYQILQGDVRDCCRSMAAESVHCVVTSPPYWGLRDYGVPGQMGLERTPEEYVAGQVEVFREVKRVLRSDGTLWLNLGETWYSGTGSKTGFDPKNSSRRHGMPCNAVVPGLKPKNLVGIPWRVAFALQADGWYLRDCIIWHKPNPMPGSMRDRTCTSHEYIFLLSRSRRYYFDQIAISEPASTKQLSVTTSPSKAGDSESMGAKINRHTASNGGRYHPETRNPRSVWRISSRSYKEAHFATFPEALPARCIKAGTSEHGVCCQCGAPWKRQTVKTLVPTRAGKTPGRNSRFFKERDPNHSGQYKADRYAVEVRGRASAHADSPYHSQTNAGNADPQRHITRIETVGWEPACTCEAETVPATVLDPFSGAGTTGLAALNLGRSYIGAELNPDYVALTHDRLRTFSESLF